MIEASLDSLRLTIERTIHADRRRVFDAWTQPELIRIWSAPEGLSVEDGAMDVRVGGRWRVVMAEPNGTRHEAFGRYLEVVPPERLVYTHAWAADGGGSTPETVVTIDFRAEGGATRLVFTQAGFGSIGSRKGHEEGWESTINRLVAMLEEQDDS